MADGLLAQGLNYIDQQKQALAARLGLLVNNPQEFANQLGSEARQRAGVGLLGEPKTAQDMASGAWINSPYGQQAMQAGSGFAGTTIPIKRIYRGSYDNSPMYKVEENYKGNDIFGGVFGSPELMSAKSHGSGSVHYTDIPENKILKQQDFNVLPPNKIKNALLKARPDLKNDKNLFDKVYDIVINDKNTFEYPDEVIKNAFKKSDLGDASFEAQRLRGQVSKNLGYKAVEMVDEHGMSYLVSPGAEFTQLYKAQPVYKSVSNKPIINSNIDPNTPIQKRQRGVFNK